MSFIKRVILLSATVAVTVILTNFYVCACPTPVFDSLTPNLQEIMKLDAEKTKRLFPQNHSNESLEEMAERDLCRGHVVIDGTLYRGHGGPMKLTNEDIESLYNLPFVKELDLKRFDLKDVDITKFLNINKNKTIKILDLWDCFFSLKDNEIKSIIKGKGYEVVEGSKFWILWPGVDIYDIIDGGRLKNCH